MKNQLTRLSRARTRALRKKIPPKVSPESNGSPDFYFLGSEAGERVLFLRPFLLLDSVDSGPSTLLAHLIAQNREGLRKSIQVFA